jgi:hypothetical protein
LVQGVGHLGWIVVRRPETDYRQRPDLHYPTETVSGPVFP